MTAIYLFQKVARTLRDIEKVHFIHPPCCEHPIPGPKSLNESKLPSLLFSVPCQHCGKPLEGCGLQPKVLASTATRYTQLMENTNEQGSHVH